MTGESVVTAIDVGDEQEITGFFIRHPNRGCMSSDAYDIVVVGGGTAGVFAAATAAAEGLDVVIVERKSEADAGHIA